MSLIAPAQAGCTSYAPAAGAVVTCSGASNTTIIGSTDVTVNFEDGAQHSVAAGGGALVYENSEINLYGSAAVTTSAGGLQINWSGSGNTNSTISLHGTSSVSSSGSGATISVNGSYSKVILNDQTAVMNTGSGDGISFSGTTTINGSNTVIIGQNASVKATGSSANAIDFFLGSNTLINYGTLSSVGITVDGSNPSSTSDMIYNYGVISSSSGAAIALRGGNDRLTLGTGSMIDGSIDGGDGTDDLTLVGSGTEDADFTNFESLTMSGTDWTLSGTSSFGSILVDSGILRLNGSITGDMQVAAAGTLGGTGTIYGDVTSSGTLSAGNSVGTATIIGDLVQNGGSFVEFDASGVDRWNVTGTATLVNNPTLTITSLDGSTTAYGVILHADGGIIGSFADPPIYDGNGEAAIIQTANDIILQVVDGTVVVADHHAAIETGLSFFDEVVPQGRGGCLAGERSRSPPTACGDHLWAKAFGQRGEEDAHDGNKSFAYAIGGMALGAEAKAAPNVSLGASLGYATSRVEVDNDAGSTNIASILGALNAQFRGGAAFFAISAGGGWQDLDLYRTAAVVAQTLEVESDTSALLLGGKLLGGLHFELPTGWALTPTLAASYLHQWVQGYDEAVGPSAVSIYDHDTGLLRLKAEIQARHSRVMDGVEFSPYLSLGVIEDLARGGRASGAFSSGAGFNLILDHSDEIRSRAGIGIDAMFENGSKASLAYHAEASGESVAHELTAEVRLLW